ncbi:MarR family winged helix-turn-helix transcriptional regulator [Deinococcus hopiensis]|uniref:DNA-binding transcriptional regulator, MarR family n=1 Tax=Deinococcus hopiensis KR-140 TaxID=695939 RepID=A0A1W1UUF7_9DEIO|nr:MarR family transcriptional regulator [Deinococcus hopiensis]SMB84703.1 DNA-binding transcriptional regulator, MarR family [Deinococcus hopiensis KR-140]
MSLTPIAAAFSDLVLRIFRLNGLLLDAGDRLTAPSGQTSSRWQVMGCIDHMPQTVAAVARTMGLTRQSVQRTADLLVADGLAAYGPNPDHKRAKLLRLTPEGQRVLTAIEQAQAAWANRVAHSLRETDLQAAVQVLAAVEGAL